MRWSGVTQDATGLKPSTASVTSSKSKDFPKEKGDADHSNLGKGPTNSKSSAR